MGSVVNPSLSRLGKQPASVCTKRKGDENFLSNVSGVRSTVARSVCARVSKIYYVRSGSSVTLHRFARYSDHSKNQQST